ncbi:hypothetical protein GJU40_00800 [Bacillus lacus]|uniref:ZIP Zinc transporter n=1 Tax=Metabacillus lacus TaxID=1983721 RepID=A0A7X2IWF2_9BACI|nr:hypothetical protein [Metabacillus lacus]MRX70707.1 hypothetical protein [Metabacillus lacus]
MEWYTLVYALGFIFVHLYSKYLTFLHTIPRSKLLSIAGGISVAYVFIHLLPELNMHQQQIDDRLNDGWMNFLNHHIYIVAMAGLASFYGLERMVKVSKKISKNSDEYARVFWIHIISFTIYNALIGYLLVRGENEGFFEMALYFIALSVHFLSNDNSLRESHEHVYDHKGRWILAGAILFGWLIGVTVEVNELILSFLFAFLAGGIVLNVLKEELPEEKESHFGAFFLGSAAYSIILILL